MLVTHLLSRLFVDAHVALRMNSLVQPETDFLPFQHRGGGIVFAERALKPLRACGFTFLVSPFILADVNPVIVLDPVAADIAVVLLQLVEERLHEVFKFSLTSHFESLYVQEYREDKGYCKHYLQISIGAGCRDPMPVVAL